MQQVGSNEAYTEPGRSRGRSIGGFVSGGDHSGLFSCVSGISWVVCNELLSQVNTWCGARRGGRAAAPHCRVVRLQNRFDILSMKWRTWKQPRAQTMAGETDTVSSLCSATNQPAGRCNTNLCPRCKPGLAIAEPGFAVFPTSLMV